MQEILTLTSPPAIMPVALADAKAFARVDITDDDTLITALITAATALVETRTKMSFVQRSYAWQLDYFPNRVVFSQGGVWVNWLNSRIYPWAQGQVLYAPKPPLVSVSSITYYDQTNTLQTLSPSLYMLTPGVPGRIAPQPSTQWPATQDMIGAVTITFTAGYSTDASLMPPQILTAIKFLVSHWYRKREAVSDVAMMEVPQTVKALLNSVNYGFYG